MFLHQRLIVKYPVHGVIDGKEIDPSVNGYLIQNGSRKIIDKRIAGQIDQSFLRQIRIKDLGSDKDVGNIVRPHLFPTVGSTKSPP